MNSKKVVTDYEVAGEACSETCRGFRGCRSLQEQKMVMVDGDGREREASIVNHIWKVVLLSRWKQVLATALLY